MFTICKYLVFFKKKRREETGCFTAFKKSIFKISNSNLFSKSVCICICKGTRERACTKNQKKITLNHVKWAQIRNFCTQLVRTLFQSQSNFP